MCPKNYWPNLIQNKCMICNTKCLNCSGPDSTECISCPDGQYLNGGECILCNSNCLTCSKSATFCISCGSPFYLFEGICNSSCIDSFWPSESKRLCEPCDIPCLTCQTPGNSISCLSCSDGFYLNNKQCLSCPIGCAICLSANNCTSCQNQYFLLNFKCLDNCEQGYFKEIYLNLCLFCNSSCLGCDGPTSNDCIKCKNGEFLMGNKSGPCEICDFNCSTCNGRSELDCLSCNEPFFLEENTCVPSCNIGYYPVLFPKKYCLKCSFSCLQCIADGENNCVSCNDTQFLNVTDSVKNVGFCYKTCPFPLINDKLNYICSEYCPLRTYKDININECVDCYVYCLKCDGSYSGNCLYCVDSRVLLNKTCVNACPEGYFANEIRRTCELCPFNCDQCTNQNKCEICVDGFYVSSYDSLCVSCKEEGSFIQNLICQNCSFGCAKCSFDSNCTRCQESFYLQNGSCNEKIHINPTIEKDDNVPLLYSLSFNNTWTGLFENLNNNKSSYSITIDNVSKKNYRYSRADVFRQDWLRR